MIKTDSEPFLSFNKNSDFITGVDTENVIEYTNGDVTTYTLRLYTQTDDFNNFTNGIVKSQNGEVATYIYRYIPSAKYVIQKSLSQDDFITYDGLLQLLNTDGSLITEQEIEDGVSKRTPTGCEPSIVASGGRWRCAAGNQHPPSQCVAINPDGICDACGTEWIVWELSTVHPCSSGGGSTGNTGNNNPYGDGGGSGSGHNDNNNTNDNSSSEDNAPVLPTEPIFGSDNEMGIEDHFNQYLCPNNQMDINDINWAYGNHAEASELWNYIYANFTSNDESDCVVIDFEEQIVFDNSWEDRPCQKNIVEQNINRNGNIPQLFTDIFDESGLPFVYFTANINYGDYAQTTNEGSSTSITYGEPALLGTDLVMAVVTQHEILHASLYEINQNGNTIDIGSDATYGELLEAWADYKTNGGDQSQQHDFIEQYRNSIAQTVYDWAITDGGYTANATFNLDYVKKLAWLGLTTDFENEYITEAWEVFSANPANATEVAEILDIIDSETNPFFNDNNPIKEPCLN